MLFLVYFIFFFQAEDGIRDLTVTGVQTCALPILSFAHPKNVALLRRGRTQSDEHRCPPSTGTQAPVIHDPASVTNSRNRPLSSSGLPRRRIGMRLISALPWSVSHMASVISVSM